MGSCEKRQESPRVHSPFWNAKHGAELRGEARPAAAAAAALGVREAAGVATRALAPWNA